MELNPPEATTNVGSGIASTQVVAKGGRVSSVVVVARVEDKVALSPAVTFAGASSNARQFTFQYGQIAGAASGGVHAIGAYDETHHLIAGVKLNCVAHVGDRNGNGGWARGALHGAQGDGLRRPSVSASERPPAKSIDRRRLRS